MQERDLLVEYWMAHGMAGSLERQLIKQAALDGVAQRIECQPVNQKVTGLIPSQGTFLGCRPCP